MTIQEINNIYEWKLIKKILKKNYDWIIKFEIDDDDFDKYKGVFIKVFIDPFAFADEFDVKIFNFWKQDIGTKDMSGIPLTSIFNISRANSVDLEDQMNSEIKYIHKSNSLPDEFKIKKPRYFTIAEFVIPKDIEKPDNFDDYFI